MELSRGPTATCLRFGKEVVTNNCQESDDFIPWSTTALKYDIRSSIVLPLKVDNLVIGCLNIYSSNTNSFDELEVTILKRLANKLSIALSIKKQEQEKEDIRFQLSERLKELSTIYKFHSLLQAEDVSIENALSQIIELIPKGYQFPEICNAKIFYDGQEYVSKNYCQSQMNQTARFETVNGKTGYIEVNYVIENSSINNLGFLEEEKDMINTLSVALKEFYSKEYINSELRKSEARLNSMFNNTEVGHLLLGKDLKIISFNALFASRYRLVTGMKVKENDYFYSILLNEKHSIVEEAIKK